MNVSPKQVEEIVLEKAEEERQELRRLISDYDVKVSEALALLVKTEDERFKAWLKVEKSIPKKQREEGKLADADPEIRRVAELADRHWESANSRLHGYEAARVQALRKLKLLDDPVEIQRRIDVRETTQALRERKQEERREQREARGEARREARIKAPVVTAREQGFPEVYLRENGNFKPGFDATAKSDLLKAALGLKESAKHKFTKPQALKLLETRGWMGYLETKKRVLEKGKKR